MRDAILIALFCITVFYPSATLLRMPIYEADAMGLYETFHPTNRIAFYENFYREDSSVNGTSEQIWGGQGRLVSQESGRAFASLSPYPRASQEMAVVFAATYLLMCVTLLVLLSYLYQSWRYAAFITILISCHFHFWEARMLNGHETAASLTAQMVALLVATIFPSITLPLLAASTVVALNTHQCGAMFPVVYVTLMVAAEREPKLALRMFQGFLLGCVFYAGQLAFHILQGGPFVTRANGEIVKNLGRFFLWFPRTIAVPLPGDVYAHPWLSWCVGAAPWIVLLVLHIFCASRNRIPRAAIIWLGIVLSAAPNIVTNGFFPSRTLLCATIGYWAGLGLLAQLVLKEFGESGRRWLTRTEYLLLIPVVLIHLRGWGLLLTMKSAPGRCVPVLAAEFQRLKVPAGAAVDFFVTPREEPALDWGDIGGSVFARNWGAVAYFAQFGGHGHTEFPAGLKVTYRAKEPWPFHDAAMMEREANGRIAINGDALLNIP